MRDGPAIILAREWWAIIILAVAIVAGGAIAWAWIIEERL